MTRTNGHGGSAPPEHRSARAPARTSDAETGLRAPRSRTVRTGTGDAARHDEALARRKVAVRSIARQRRADAHARLHGRAARAVADAVLHTVPLPVLSVVSGYMPIGDELDPLPLMSQLAARGLTCALPVVTGADRPLLFREWTPGMALQEGPYGIPEPAADAFELRPSVLLVPLLAFDRSGRRMGYGGGFYDRTLATLRADAAVVAVGLAYADQEVDEVPAGSTDQQIDWVVTERQALAFSPLGGFGETASHGPGDAEPDDLLRP